jgi:hypothetical protein
MRCKQKSCKRNQNANIPSGFCYVCEEVATDTTNDINKKNDCKKQGMKKVIIDYKEMAKLYESCLKVKLVTLRVQMDSFLEES